MVALIIHLKMKEQKIVSSGSLGLSVVTKFYFNYLKKRIKRHEADEREVLTCAIFYLN